MPCVRAGPAVGADPDVHSQPGCACGLWVRSKAPSQDTPQHTVAVEAVVTDGSSVTTWCCSAATLACHMPALHISRLPWLVIEDSTMCQADHAKIHGATQATLFSSAGNSTQHPRVGHTA